MQGSVTAIRCTHNMHWRCSLPRHPHGAHSVLLRHLRHARRRRADVKRRRRQSRDADCMFDRRTFHWIELASVAGASLLLVRKALAECFSVTCEVVAFAEPTTNLDAAHAPALAGCSVAHVPLLELASVCRCSVHPHLHGARRVLLGHVRHDRARRADDGPRRRERRGVR